MKNRFTIVVLTMTLGGLGFYALNEIGTRNPRAVEQVSSHELNAAEGTVASEDSKTALESEAKAIQANARTSESFESEFRSASDEALRTEVKTSDATLGPLIDISNSRPLSMAERSIVANNLRKKQALLKILIDRQIIESKARVNL